MSNLPSPKMIAPSQGIQVSGPTISIRYLRAASAELPLAAPLAGRTDRGALHASAADRERGRNARIAASLLCLARVRHRSIRPIRVGDVLGSPARVSPGPAVSSLPSITKRTVPEIM